MTTVFIAGSIKIKNLHESFVERISKIVSDQLNVIVGDANGADTAIQMELDRQSADNVMIYCTNEYPRNNVGSWNFRQVHTLAHTGTRAFFTAKDIEMANVADFGLMLWDKASTGTLSNVFELIKNKKKCVVFLNKEQRFINVRNSNDINTLISTMSDPALRQAERKIGVRGKILELTNEQIGMEI